MMEFIMLTLSVALGIVLSTVVLVLIAMNKKVMKAYMNWAKKITEMCIDDFYQEEKDES